MMQIVYWGDILRFLFVSQDITIQGSVITGLTPSGSLVAANMVDGFWLSLHTAYPGVGGAQNTNEVTTGQYQNYVRMKLSRAPSPSAHWEIALPSAYNKVGVTWPVAGAASAGCTITHVGLGRDQSGAGVLYCAGPLTSSIAASSPATSYNPSFVTATGLSHTIIQRQHLYDITAPTRIEVYPIYDYALPGGLSAGTAYYAKRITADIFQLFTDAAATPGNEVNVTTQAPFMAVQTSTGTAIPAGGGNTYVHMRAYPTSGFVVSFAA